MLKSIFGNKHKRRTDWDAFCKDIAHVLNLKTCILSDHTGKEIAGVGSKAKGDVTLTVTDNKLRVNFGGSTHSESVLRNVATGLAQLVTGECRGIAVVKPAQPGWPILIRDQQWLANIGDGRFWTDLHLPGIGSIDPGARFKTSMIKQEAFTVGLTRTRGKQFIKIVMSPLGDEPDEFSEAKFTALGHRKFNSMYMSHYLAVVTMIARTPDPTESQSSRMFDTRDKTSQQCPFLDCTLILTIGRGSFGVVWKANRTGHGTVALKATRVMASATSFTEPKMVHMESALATGLNHPNIVEMYDVRTIRKGASWETWFMLEYCERGSINKLHDSPTPQLCVQRCLDIATGMVYLHQKNIIHGDLTAANVLVDRDGTCKITDFGISRMLMSESVRTESYGTVTYMPPELLAKRELSLGSDVYSFGVIMWEIWHSEGAWGGVMPATLLAGKVSGNLQLDWREIDNNETTFLAFKALSLRCLSPVEQRPTFLDIVQALTLMHAAEVKRTASFDLDKVLPLPEDMGRRRTISSSLEVVEE